jgi:hypothetical protein
MGFDWEKVLGTHGQDLADTYDMTASGALYQDHARAEPPGAPVDMGDDLVVLPFDES